MALSDLVSRNWDRNQLFSALIELTYRCNLDCFFCYNDLSLRGKPLSFEQYRKLFEELQELGCLSLILSGGEPLAHPQFFKLGALAKELGFLVRIKSNGHALGERLATRLKNEVDPFIVETSLHGACAETHDRQTRVKGSFERLIKNIGVMQGLGLRVKVNSTLTRWNEHEVDAMLELTEQLGVSHVVDPEVTPRDDGDTSPLNISPSADGITNLIHAQRRHAARKQQSDRSSAHQASDASNASNASPVALSLKVPGAPKQPSQKHCGVGSSTLAVDPFGQVYPCVQYRRAIGNLHERGIGAIWQDHNPVLGEIRNENMQVREMVKARGLGSYCPGQAYHSSGDALKVPQAVLDRQALLDRMESDS